MNYLISLITFLLVNFNLHANEFKTNEILFKIENKVFTNIDLEIRTEYISSSNKLNITKLTKSEKKEILNDYISALIFYEYYVVNNINYKNIIEEVDLLYKNNFNDVKKLNDEEVKNFKFNIYIDLIRKKIIEERLNFNKESLFNEVGSIDLLYNYNLRNIIIKENLLDIKIIKNISERDNFNELKKFLTENRIDFFYKEENIDDNSIISNKIRNIIDEDIPIYLEIKNGYINLISIIKNLESYEGIFVELINFITDTPLKKKDIQCNKIRDIIDINKTVFKEYEYSKLNNNIKNNLKSINDYIIIDDNDNYNYIILCNMTYDENLLKDINFNKNINSLVNKIQKNFLKTYKNEFKFIQIK
ncbi:MAG: hypothetical protein ISQ38_00810 [Alphaproteobacteria bacterium]|nr:hypothetical protein [Alphaproteobacteria bacterium]